MDVTFFIPLSWEKRKKGKRKKEKRKNVLM
jgi:hypothetical protein